MVHLEELVHLELQLFDLAIESLISIELLMLFAIKPFRVLKLAEQRLMFIVKLFPVGLELRIHFFQLLPDLQKTLREWLGFTLIEIIRLGRGACPQPLSIRTLNELLYLFAQVNELSLKLGELLTDLLAVLLFEVRMLGGLTGLELNCNQRRRRGLRTGIASGKLSMRWGVAGSVRSDDELRLVETHSAVFFLAV